MRIAVVSDIHGNLPALNAVLAAIAEAGADLTVNLGDIVSGPLWPLETAQRLMPLGLPTIAGNHERQLLTRPPGRIADSDARALDQLGDTEVGWLRSLPAGLQPTVGVRCCHGTPASDLIYLLETVTDDFGRNGSRGIRAATPSEVAARIGRIDAAVLLCGHSHVPRAIQLPAGPLVVNPGSVGLPAYDDEHPHPHWVENGQPQARWALIEATAGGAWRAELHATDYDWSLSADRAETRGRGDWADALRTGRVGRTEREALARHR